MFIYKGKARQKVRRNETNRAKIQRQSREYLTGMTNQNQLFHSFKEARVFVMHSLKSA